MPSTSPSKLRRLVRHLDELAASDDLAAVLIHINDTYLIEARPPEVPGLARIARLVKFLKRHVRRRTREDTVLTLHAGDMLSPSYLSHTLELKGEQMVAALNACELCLATLGNHEFEFGEQVLRERLEQADFDFVMTNPVAPESYPIRRLVLWPPEAPFVAIIGMGGEAVRKKAVKNGFKWLGTEEALTQVIAEIAADTRIGALVVLSHMERHEDHALVDLVRRHWPRKLCAYVLGGHDHDMNWYEPRGNTLFLKNLANGRTISVVPIRKSALVTVGTAGFQQYRSPEHEMRYALTGSDLQLVELRALREVADPKALLAEIDAREHEREAERMRAERWPTLDAIGRSAMRAWLRRAPSAARRDHKRAFLRHVVAAIPRHDEVALRRDANDGLANETLIMDADAEALNDWCEPWVIGAEQGLQALREDPATLRIVSERLASPGRASADERAHVVFDTSRNPTCSLMDACETSLRSRSTNFGNFVCDAIRAATGAHLALVHSGTFRADDLFGAGVTVGNLIDTFLYDSKPGALVEVNMARWEIDALYAFAATKAGLGAFLQSSDKSALTSDPAAQCRVVICRYLLTRDSEDGFLAEIATMRKLELADAESALDLPTLADKKLLDLVVEGAAAVVYSDEQRVGEKAVVASPLEREWAALIYPLRTYWTQSQQESFKLADAMLHLEGSESKQATPLLDGLRMQVWETIRSLMRSRGTIRLDPQLLDFIARSKEGYTDGIRYDFLLERGWGYVYSLLWEVHERRHERPTES